MEVIIFIAYLTLALFALLKIPFFKNSGITKPQLLSLFLIKVAAGFAYARFYLLPKYYPGSDTWRFYRLSKEESQWLIKDPTAFIKDLFVYGYQRPGNLFSGENSYWNDLKSNVPVKLMAVMNLLTNYSYWTNIILFNVLFIVGLVALFKLCNQLFPGKKLLIIWGLFLLPSTLFWCSGIHKDGLILSATGVLIYCIYKCLEDKPTIGKSLIIIVSGLLIFSLRNYVLLALIPAVFCFFLSKKYPLKTGIIFLVVYTTGVILFFVVPLIVPALNFPGFIASKQQEFLRLDAGSVTVTESLVPTLRGFISFFPKAIDMAFLRPHITEARNFSYIPAAAEIILLFGLVLATIFLRDRNQERIFTFFLVVFALSILLIAGYTIPFTGAIVRYRSFALPFLITPLLCSVRTSLTNENK